jgi:hypothetical protein
MDRKSRFFSLSLSLFKPESSVYIRAMFFFLFLFLYEMYENKRERERAELRLNHRALNIDDDVIYISQSKVEPFILFHFIFFTFGFKMGKLNFLFSDYYYLV